MGRSGGGYNTDIEKGFRKHWSAVVTREDKEVVEVARGNPESDGKYITFLSPHTMSGTQTEEICCSDDTAVEEVVDIKKWALRRWITHHDGKGLGKKKKLKIVLARASSQRRKY